MHDIGEVRVYFMTPLLGLFFAPSQPHLTVGHGHWCHLTCPKVVGQAIHLVTWQITTKMHITWHMELWNTCQHLIIMKCHWGMLGTSCIHLCTRFWKLQLTEHVYIYIFTCLCLLFSSKWVTFPITVDLSTLLYIWSVNNILVSIFRKHSTINQFFSYTRHKCIIPIST